MVLLGKPWTYISEGNMHIVLQLLGTDFVLRIIKEDGNPTDLECLHNCVDFVNFIINPLLQERRISLQEIVKLSYNEMSDLNENLHKYRPEQRKFKSVLCQYAVKVSNLTIISSKCSKNYCIEIKPKEGFIAKEFKYISKCYYCLNQFSKLRDQRINNISKYCPLDLFSGNKNRMKNSLKNLVDNPQNNFKLFLEGKLVYGENVLKTEFENIIKNMEIFNYTDLFYDFIIETLLSDGTACISSLREGIDNILQENKQYCMEDNNLEKKTYLYKLLQLQKLSNELILDDKQENPENLAYVADILSVVRSNKLNLNIDRCKENFFSMISHKDIALISAIAKDCSIMISFTSDRMDGYPAIQVGEHKVLYRVAVTDLEPKSPKTLEKRMKNVKKLLNLYEENIRSSDK